MLQRLSIPANLDGNVWRYASPAGGNRRHRHAELELNLVIRGRGTYLLGSRRYQIRRGDLLWLFPAQEHVLFEQSIDFEMWVVVFRRRAIKRNAKDALSRKLLLRSFRGEVCRRLGQQEFLKFDMFFAELKEAVEQPALLNAGLGYALLRAWNYFEFAMDVPVRQMHPAVERAAWMIQNDAATGSFANLAKQVGVSASRLSRLFKEQMGMGMVEFRNRRRIEKFLEVYEAGDAHTLISAALDAGFGSYPQFHRVFRRLMGHSPSEHQHW